MEHSLNPNIYEINTLVWLNELSRVYGKDIGLGNVPAEQWDRLQRLGFDYVWLMGVWQRSREGLRFFRQSPEWPRLRDRFDAALRGWKDEDVAGSPYAIAAYVPEPRIGAWTDLDAAREELRRRGMKLVLDFVPNHTAPDHPWVFENPDYYIQGSEREFEQQPESFLLVERGAKIRYTARGRDPYFSPWPDTAQLNYFNPELRSAMIGELKKIAGHCDGVRCDMAMLVLNDVFENTWGRTRAMDEHERPEFWRQVRGELPEFLLIAEAYWDLEWTLQQLGFDYVYDKKLYDRLLGASGREVKDHLAADVSYQKKLVRFLENHDEPRSAAVFGGDRMRAAIVLYSTLPGMKLYQHGQLEGLKSQIPLLLSRVTDGRHDEALTAFYGKMLAITGGDAFRRGEWKLLNVSSAGDDRFADLIAFRWKDDGHVKVVVVNYGDTLGQGRVSLADELSGDADYRLTDELNDRQYVRNGKDLSKNGLHVVLEGFHVHLFDVRAL